LNKRAYCGHVNQKSYLHKVTKLPSKDIEAKQKKNPQQNREPEGKNVERLK